MFQFVIRETGPAAELVVSRALMILAGLAILFLSGYPQPVIQYGLAILLLTGALFIQYLTGKMRLPLWSFLLVVAIALFVTGFSWFFSAIVLVIGLSAGLIRKPSKLTADEKGIYITRLFMHKFYPWTVFNNLVVKDGVITLDFKSNRVLQLDVEETGEAINEKAANDFFIQHLQLSG